MTSSCSEDAPRSASQTNCVDVAELLGSLPEVTRPSPCNFGLEEWTALLHAGQHRQRVLHLLHSTVVDGISCKSQQEIGAAVALLGDYLDLMVVPMVLQKPSLRDEALQCPCKRCGNALKAIHHLERPVLALLREAGSLHFLGDFLEEVTEGIARSGNDPSELCAAVQAAECLAVLGAFARLQDGELYHMPEGVVRSFSILLRQKWTVDYTHSVAISLHVLRNVAGNYQEVMDTSAEVFRECFHRVFGLGDEMGAEVGAEATRRLPSAPMTSGAESGLPSGSEAAGNPQESDECHAGEACMKQQEGIKVPETQKVNDLPQSKAATSRLRCDRRFALSSLCLQAIFQSTELLQSLPLSEEEIRQKVMAVAQEARREDLSQENLTRLSFHGIRLYFLICRSSHARRQYAVLEPSVLEEERRTVAFMLSVSRDHCILLRAMAQDVQSWLMWQSQAFAKRRTPSDELQRRRHKRGKQSSRPTQPQEPTPEVALTAEGASVQPIGLFTAGEAVWMAHSLLVLAIAVCLVAYWNSLEHTPASQAAVAKTGRVAGYLLYWR